MFQNSIAQHSDDVRQDKPGVQNQFSMKVFPITAAYQGLPSSNLQQFIHYAQSCIIYFRYIQLYPSKNILYK